MKRKRRGRSLIAGQYDVIRLALTAIYFLMTRDNRERIDPSRYTVADIERATSGRMPGEVSGQQLIIRNCKAS
jgi:hypothetical protein